MRRRKGTFFEFDLGTHITNNAIDNAPGAILKQAVFYPNTKNNEEEQINLSKKVTKLDKRIAYLEFFQAVVNNLLNLPSLIDRNNPDLILRASVANILFNSLMAAGLFMTRTARNDAIESIPKRRAEYEQCEGNPQQNVGEDFCDIEAQLGL